MCNFINLNSRTTILYLAIYNDNIFINVLILRISQLFQWNFPKQFPRLSLVPES
jgi:hypothetical protein